MSSINLAGAISGLSTQQLTDAVKEAAQPTKTDKTESFDSLFQAAINLVGSTNGYIQQAQQAEIDYAMGELTNTHELAIIQQKANVALQYTVAIKNGIVSAYKEIMQMQV